MAELCGHLSDADIDKMLEIYNGSFDLLRTNRDTFIARLGINRISKTFLKRVNGKIAGFSVFYENAVLLLCVDAGYRNKGMGTELLRHTEKEMMANHGGVILGGKDGIYLVAGVPMDKKSNFHMWFEKRGYCHIWTSFDMVIQLEKFTPFGAYCNIGNITFRKRNENDADEIKKSCECAQAVENGWGKCYDCAGLNVELALDGDRVIGVNIINSDHSSLFPLSVPNAGEFGCLAVLEEYRGRGIGAKLCQDALLELGNRGCQVCFIGYTYLDEWYGKFGAEKYISYWMGEKAFTYCNDIKNASL